MLQKAATDYNLPHSQFLSSASDVCRQTECQPRYAMTCYVPEVT